MSETAWAWESIPSYVSDAFRTALPDSAEPSSVGEAQALLLAEIVLELREIGKTLRRMEDRETNR